MKKRKYTHPLFNSTHWRFYWDIFFHEERLEPNLKDLYNAMKKDLYETQYISKQNKQKLQEELDKLYPPLNKEYSR